MNRGIAPSTVNPSTMAEVLTALVATGRKFVIAKSWCSKEDHYVCWIEQHNKCQYGMPFTGTTIEQAITYALRWIGGEETWLHPVGVPIDDAAW